MQIIAAFSLNDIIIEVMGNYCRTSLVLAKERGFGWLSSPAWPAWFGKFLP
jgi:hypothetical protein